jgi:pimeloyl-ACP methyl ester carboxylesterase
LLLYYIIISNIMRRLATNQGKSFVRFYDYPLREAMAQGLPTKASVLFSHATGFHGRVFDKTISFLDPSMYSCYTFDQRGHGHSPWPEDAPEDALGDWDGFGHDVLDVSRYVRQQHPDSRQHSGGIVGVGHSQGATALLLAALQEPRQFSALVLYEPVIFPRLWRDLSKVFAHFSESPLALSSRRRRLEFDSLQQAFENFASKPPMSSFHVDVLRDYVRYGTESCGDGERVRLLCDPNIEVGD